MDSSNEKVDLISLLLKPAFHRCNAGINISKIYILENNNFIFWITELHMDPSTFPGARPT